MTHRAESIMAAVETAITGLTTTGARVVRARVRTVENAPALSLEQGADDVNPELSNYPKLARELNIKIFAHVKDNDTADTNLNLIREEVFSAMMADRTLGLAYVVDVDLIGDDEPEFTGDSDQIVGRQQMNFVVKYRHSWTDAGA